MRALALAAFVITAPTVSWSQSISYCEESWLTRNMIFDRGGHCFRSTLGQSLFSNGDCNPAGAILSPEETETVTRMRSSEDRVGCNVNTAAGPSAAMLAAFAEYARFDDVPGLDELGWACWGYTGAPVLLHSGARPNSAVIAQLVPGQSAVFQHWPRNGWTFATVVTGPSGDLIARGWIQGGLPGDLCQQVAG